MAENRPARSGQTAKRAAKKTAKRAAPRSSARRGPEDAAHAACESLERLICHAAEGVSAVRRKDDGWCVVVDVLEVPRIPDTTSLLASYEVQVDERGELMEYSRVRRYRRGSADE
ncbi:gas vesicle protein [[Kitasatospora] papulosa]|uniref:gas vesicle protein GvpO n=1 Tax=Streptomyces TaxID=1883 RepID=UPI0034412506